MTEALKDSKDAFIQLKQMVDPELAQVNQLLLGMAGAQDTDLIEEISRHIMSAGGKRIRPVICLAVAGLFAPEGMNHIYLAAAIECIHTATLLHDDVIDESQTRRGLKTANNIWGDKASILVGDFLFSQAFKLMVKTESLESLGLLAHTSAVISESEVQQLQEIGNIEFGFELYLKLINAKTAQLFAAAAAVGAMAAGADKAQVESCFGYGENLGMCFQIVDDILDYMGDNNSFGKKLGNDFYEGKVTAPMMFAIKNADSAGKKRIYELFAKRDEVESFAAMRQVIIDNGGIRDALLMAEEYCRTGQSHLKDLPECAMKQGLYDMINFIIKREY